MELVSMRVAEGRIDEIFDDAVGGDDRNRGIRHTKLNGTVGPTPFFLVDYHDPREQ